MTRHDFMAQLRRGLAGMPAVAIEDVIADYAAHFDEGLAAGRSEAELAAALGDPDRLARELRAEAGMKAWSEIRSPSTAVAAIFAVLGLGAIDILILLPILVAVAGVLSLLLFLCVIFLCVGGVLLVCSPFAQGSSVLGVMLAGVGLMAGSVSAGAVLALVTIGLVNGLIWYGRLHYRVLKPAAASW